jgi:hypothetical protein
MLGMAVLTGGKAAASVRQTVTNTPDAVREKFAGIYKLVSYAPHGSNPAGRIYYESSRKHGGYALSSR